MHLRVQDLCLSLSTLQSQLALDAVYSTFSSQFLTLSEPVKEWNESVWRPSEHINKPGEWLNNFYQKNRKACIQSLRRKIHFPHCTLSPEVIFAYFHRETLTSEMEALRLITPFPGRFVDSDSLTAPLTREEVSLKLARTNKASAPGPSGISFKDLSNAPSIDLLVLLFNAVLRIGRIPSAWKRAKLILIYKSGPVDRPSSWRPIAVQETVSRLFSGLLADRLQFFAQRHALLPVWQRAASGSDGCVECNQVLDFAVEQAKASRSQIHLISLDIRNALGSIN